MDRAKQVAHLPVAELILQAISALEKSGDNTGISGGAGRATITTDSPGGLRTTTSTPPAAPPPAAHTTTPLPAPLPATNTPTTTTDAPTTNTTTPPATATKPPPTTPSRVCTPSPTVPCVAVGTDLGFTSSEECRSASVLARPTVVLASFGDSVGWQLWTELESRFRAHGFKGGHLPWYTIPTNRGVMRRMLWGRDSWAASMGDSTAARDPVKRSVLFFGVGSWYNWDDNETVRSPSDVTSQTSTDLLRASCPDQIAVHAAVKDWSQLEHVSFARRYCKLMLGQAAWMSDLMLLAEVVEEGTRFHNLPPVVFREIPPSTSLRRRGCTAWCTRTRTPSPVVPSQPTWWLPPL